MSPMVAEVLTGGSAQRAWFGALEPHAKAVI